MSGKLDQSLDQIMQDSGSTGRGRGRNGAGGRPGGRRAAQKAKAAIAAPIGGVQKSIRAPTKPAKAPVMAAPRKPAFTGDTKVMISGLPLDVDEPQLKDYILKAIGAAKRVMLTYGPDGRSRGMATVTFANRALATKCVGNLNGVRIDNRPLRVEFVVDASQGSTPTQGNGLADRMSKPKNTAKEVKAAPKAKAKAAVPVTNGAAKPAKGPRGKKGGNAGRPKKKTADELDAEMMDYFGNESAPANGTAAPAVAAATNGAEPVDEVM